MVGKRVEKNDMHYSLSWCAGACATVRVGLNPDRVNVLDLNTRDEAVFYGNLFSMPKGNFAETVMRCCVVALIAANFFLFGGKQVFRVLHCSL
jgi:hypothetical protein